MIFNEAFEFGDCSNRDSYIRRQAVRAVVSRGNQLLLIHTNKGDYKFPGGGIEQDESHQEAIIREVMEETGYPVDGVHELLGVILEKRPDKIDDTKIFEMTSYYYICDVADIQKEQCLDDYEAKLDFKPVWVSLNYALSNNCELINNDLSDLNPWICREAFVLQALRSSCFNN